MITSAIGVLARHFFWMTTNARGLLPGKNSRSVFLFTQMGEYSPLFDRFGRFHSHKYLLMHSHLGNYGAIY